MSEPHHICETEKEMHYIMLNVLNHVAVQMME